MCCTINSLNLNSLITFGNNSGKRLLFIKLLFLFLFAHETNSVFEKEDEHFVSQLGNGNANIYLCPLTKRP